MHLNIPELLASNSLPTEAERVHLNQLLDTSNEEISRLTVAIDKLVLEREKLRSNVVTYKAALAPIRLLPEDMLREIFVSCLPSNKAAATTIKDAPLLLGRICRSWRELALSTPELWASIRIQFLQEFNSLRVQRLCNEAHDWIARSGTCPLTIEVTCRNEDPVAHNFLDSLTKLSKRWRSIEIDAPVDWMPSLVSLSKSDVPRLERFRHFATEMSMGSQIDTFWQLLGILEGERLCDINFGQLTRLELNAGSELTSRDAADILKRCPDLVACRLSIAIPQSTDLAWRFAPVTLVQLVSLTIDLAFSFPGETSSDDIVFQAFFSNLDLPQLTSFSPSMGPYISWITLARASPIENLTLSLSDLTHQSVLEYLRTSTSLKRLRFNTWPSMTPDNMPGPELNLFMAIDDANAVICPFLEVLELPFFGFSEEIFVKLVKRRAALEDSEGKAHLKVVRANFTASGFGIQLDILSQLDDLLTSGLSLSISYYQYLKPEDRIAYWPCQLPEMDWP
ncbi:hypothetical protein C8J56DRAFT_484188 [Mycena floridula]|nr:hypothetical protein C8J56DRAFT_484188 [Mycena floridula]